MPFSRKAGGEVYRDGAFPHASLSAYDNKLVLYIFERLLEPHPLLVLLGGLTLLPVF